jgi:DNA gyrase/topoisomerase IV subunit A
MHGHYLDYAMSVIIVRFTDARSELHAVHRRILRHVRYGIAPDSSHERARVS